MTKDVLETNQLCSFRDPSARVVVTSGRVLRVATGPEGQSIKEFLESRLAEALEAEGKLVHTRLCDRADAGSLVWEHERVPFPSYPYEWPPEMVHSAAELTLDLARRALAEGYGLKDATPCNVLFRGPRPVFVDVASFERRDLRDPVWLAYAQFVRTFLLPLAADKYLGITPADVFINHRDGLSPEAVHAMLPAARKLHPFFLEWVTLPALISRTGAARSGGIYRPRRSTDSEQARFTLEVHLKRFERALRRVAPDSGRKSAWSDYPATAAHYDQRQLAAKEEFVRAALAEVRPRRILDVGSNTGHFSALAAQLDGAEVVGIDSDAVAAGRAWRMARDRGLNILPLVVDLARPTPAVGWKNRECASFLDRAAGEFDCVLMLAVLHHMLVAERVPLEEILDLAAQLTRDLAVIEFVAPQDPMFRELTRGRDHLHEGLSVQSFEQACGRWFRVCRQERLPELARWMFVLRRLS